MGDSNNDPEIMLPKLISLLWRYSLISVEENGDLTIHRLVQTVIREQTEHQNLNIQNFSNSLSTVSKEWFNRLLMATHNEFCREFAPKEDDERRALLLPHLQSLASHCETLWGLDKSLPLEDIFEDIATVLDKNQCSFKAANIYYEKAFKCCLQKYEQDSPRLAKSLVDLGHNQRNLRNYTKSIQNLEHGLKIYEKVYGPFHLLTADPLDSLGHAYRNINKFHKSRDMLERALKIIELEYGKDHLKLAKILSNLGNTYRNLAQYQKSFEYLFRAIKILEREYGPDHRLLLPTLVNLGATYRDAGDLKKGIEYLERVKKGYEEFYGKEHPYVAIALTNLGEAFYLQKNYQKAKSAFEGALIINKREYGENHIHLAFTYSYLGEIYKNLKDHENSKGFFEKALKINENEHALANSENKNLTQ